MSARLQINAAILNGSVDFFDFAPAGARGGFRSYIDPYTIELVITCMWCGKTVRVDPRRLDCSPGAFVDAIETALKPHWHVLPKPFTTSEKDRIRRERARRIAIMHIGRRRTVKWQVQP